MVLVPALGRPWRVKGLQESLQASEGFTQLDLLYILSPEDTEQRIAVEHCGIDYLTMPVEAGSGDYARKMNLGARLTDQDWIFLAADDLAFRRNWADRAIDAAEASGKLVVGTNDLGNAEVKRGKHSTHTLVHRQYLQLGTADDPSRLLHEGYDHNWVDAEFIETAKARGQFVFAKDVVVEHLHPHWGKSKMDSTYEKGLAHYEDDRRLFLRRRHLWGGNPGSWRTPLLGVSVRGRYRENEIRD